LESRRVQTPPVVVGVSRNQPGTTKGVEKVTNFSPQVGQSPEKFDHNNIPEVKEKEKSSVPDTCNKNNVGKHNKSVPGWKKSDYFLKSHPNIHIETGADKTGNILSMDNFLHCRAKYGSSMDLITGDGGFDFSADFNNQEMNITKLLFAQMCYALCLQKHNGSFILKIFDCFMEHTVDILYILSAFYETVYITKPKTSRYANSEKYLVCKNFLLFDDSSVFPCLKMAFQKMLGKPFEPKRVDEVGDFGSESRERSSTDSGLNLPEEFDVRRTSNNEGQSPVRYPREVSTLVELFEHENISRFLKIPIPAYFIYKLEEYNTIYGQQQIENIYQTIVLIEQIRPEHEDKEVYYGNNSPQGSLIGLRPLTRVDAVLWKDAHLPEKFVDFPHTSSERSLWGINPCGLNSVDFSHTKGVEKVTNFSPQVGQSPVRDPRGVSTLVEKFDYRRCSDVPQSSKINNLIRTHLRKCVHWCLNHNIPYNIMDD